MTLEDFDSRTRANMEVALERACEKLPSDQSGEHSARGFVAQSIIDAAHRGEKTLSGLTKAGFRAVSEVVAVH